MGYYPQESLYKPYKYHGFILLGVHGTPNCPLKVDIPKSTSFARSDELSTKQRSDASPVASVPEPCPGPDTEWVYGVFTYNIYIFTYSTRVSMEVIVTT